MFTGVHASASEPRLWRRGRPVARYSISNDFAKQSSRHRRSLTQSRVLFLSSSSHLCKDRFAPTGAGKLRAAARTQRGRFASCCQTQGVFSFREKKMPLMKPQRKGIRANLPLPAIVNCLYWVVDDTLSRTADRCRCRGAYRGAAKQILKLPPQQRQRW